MSIDFSLKLKGHTVNEELIINEIDRLGLNINLNYIDRGNVSEFDSTYELLGFYIVINKNEKAPHNFYTTDLVENNNFEYNQTIFFGFDKETDLNFSFDKALELIFNLVRGLNTSGLLTSCMHNDICYFENNKNVYIKATGLSERIKKIKNIDNEWNCFYI